MGAVYVPNHPPMLRPGKKDCPFHGDGYQAERVCS